MGDGATDMEATLLLREAMSLREKWTCRRIGGGSVAPPAVALSATAAKELQYEMVDGIMRVGGNDSLHDAALFASCSVADFIADTDRVAAIRGTGPAVSYCYKRLRLLDAQYNVHCMLNGDMEMQEMMGIPHRDFYNVRKVDTHVHHSASMNAKHLLRFIKKKCKYFSDEVVAIEKCNDGTERPLRLRDTFERISIDPYDLNLDKLAVMADGNTFQRFDKFNLKYNPCGDSLLRTVFLKTDNYLGGRYLAELTKELFADLEETKYQLSEYRLSIYGRKPNEWRKLAQWVMGHGLISPYNKWMIQIPRIFNIYASLQMLENFEQMIDNIFRPLFEVSCNPDCDPLLHQFLAHVSGLDSVDDESKLGLDKPSVLPADWTMTENPSYRYYSYYIWANLRALNHLRGSLGMNTFKFRPHAGEAGSIENLDNTFLLADSINHGINLKLSPVLQYLYYLGQIGLAVSPLSNNLLFVDYAKNPFFTLFSRGLNVSLSTDDPLMFHQTKEPLMEEYSIAKQVWRLSSADLCELARMSVLQSGFDDECKERWLGSASPDTNDISKTNVPLTRMRFRQRLFTEEVKLLNAGDEVIGSTSPTELGYYNARMLLSPHRSSRNSEVLRQERMNTLATCECHRNGLQLPPLLDLNASTKDSNKNTVARQHIVQNVTRRDTVAEDGSTDVPEHPHALALLEAELIGGQSALDENEFNSDSADIDGTTIFSTKMPDRPMGEQRNNNSGNVDNNDSEAILMRQVAATLAQLQKEVADLRSATLVVPRKQSQVQSSPTVTQSFAARVCDWWRAFGWQGRASILAAVFLWLVGWRRFGARGMLQRKLSKH